MNRRAFALSAAALLVSPAALAQGAIADFGLKVAMGAEARTLKPETYDPAYRRIAFPMGDVADDRGVCSDVVIRAFRAAGLDLQALVHADMRAAFPAYPKIWGLAGPDPNIDHRRVPNLEVFFRRRGASLPTPIDGRATAPGDIVSWRLTGSNLPHIGIVSTRQVADRSRPMIVHNIGAGSVLEDVLEAWPQTGWFRWGAG